MTDPQTSASQPLWRLAGRWIGMFVLIPYVAVCLCMMLFERRLIYPGWHVTSGDWNPPGLKFEDVHFESADGTKLHGWYVPHPAPLAYVLWTHGNGGNVAWRSSRLQELHDLGLAVFVFDYRGYGKSAGDPDETGILADARAAQLWLADKAHLKPTDVVLMGDSLGGAVAIDLASEGGCRGLIVLCTFTSLPDAGAYHYPWLPVHALMRNRMNSLKKIGNYHGPLLQCHGDQDEVIPFAQGQAVFAAANEPKKWVTIPGADHNGCGSKEWDAAIVEFVRGLPTK